MGGERRNQFAHPRTQRRGAAQHFLREARQVFGGRLPEREHVPDLRILLALGLHRLDEIAVRPWFGILFHSGQKHRFHFRFVHAPEKRIPQFGPAFFSEENRLLLTFQVILVNSGLCPLVPTSSRPAPFAARFSATAMPAGESAPMAAGIGRLAVRDAASACRSARNERWATC